MTESYFREVEVFTKIFKNIFKTTFCNGFDSIISVMDIALTWSHLLFLVSKSFRKFKLAIVSKQIKEDHDVHFMAVVNVCSLVCHVLRQLVNLVLL